MLTKERIQAALPEVLEGVDHPDLGSRIRGKVRDIFIKSPYRVLIATDRVSAFDRVLGTIPFRGQVLNQLSAWWFEGSRDLVSNHLVTTPDPNVSIVREAEPLPVEVVVRGYITGVTGTSLWTLYHQGVERPYGLELPRGLRKNDPLPRPVITPTTKAAPGEHDQRLTSAEVVERGLVEPAVWEEVCRIALALFRRGQETARKAGLVLVDTKYEFGLLDGEITLIDEVHTPDSSRYWPAEPEGGVEPESFDKELLRLWFARQGYRGEGAPPELTDEIRVQVARRYIEIYERLTGKELVPGPVPARERIQETLTEWFLAQETQTGRIP